MNTTMTERFNVSGALLVKLFGRPRRRDAPTSPTRADGVRAVGVRSAVYGRTFFVALGLVGALAARRRVLDRRAARHLRLASRVGTLVALAAFVSRIYGPLTSLTNARVDVMTAFVSLRAGVRGARRAEPDPRPARRRRPRRPRGPIELDDVRFAYPTDADRARASRRSARGGADDDRRRRWCSHGVSAVIEPGQLVALVGPSGAGKTTLSQLVPRLYDVTERRGPHRRHDVRDLTQDIAARAPSAS